ncbi:NfeD family protein [Coraliomargarita parva]|uniref:NfeD family protein n=1 Tax=Coraliomargarita parva TaxID=3014050 RepID=UPI0022B37162|nr:NfeD family protein [Coraliomargarita parva]
MSLIIGLILAALVLVFFEVLLPGGILGLIAAVCVIAATVYAGLDYGLVPAVLVFVGSIFACLVLTVIEFKIFAKTRYGQKFFLKSAVTGHSNVEQSDDSIVGKSGETVTRLNPSGKVAIGGRHYEAYSEDGYIEAGTTVKVVAKDNFKLIIKPL